MADTKIVLISPPPSSFQSPVVQTGMSEEEVQERNEARREGPRYKTYMAKKAYAEAVMRIVREYEGTGRVGGVDLWRRVREGGVERGVEGEEEEEGGEEMLPGCGLIGAKQFAKGWFTDGLHLDVLGYRVLFEGLMEVVEEKWPELAS